jgi:hypothetical protein
MTIDGLWYSSFFNEEFFKTDKSSNTSRKRNFREALAYMAVFQSKQHKDLLPMTLDTCGDNSERDELESTMLST